MANTNPWGPITPADQGTISISNQVRAAVEQYLHVTFTSYTPTAYRTQQGTPGINFAIVLNVTVTGTQGTVPILIHVTESLPFGMDPGKATLTSATFLTTENTSNPLEDQPNRPGLLPPIPSHYGPVLPADERIQKIADNVKPAVETTLKETFSAYFAVNYQFETVFGPPYILIGLNYVIKLDVAGQEGTQANIPVLIKVFVDLEGKEILQSAEFIVASGDNAAGNNNNNNLVVTGGDGGFSTPAAATTEVVKIAEDVKAEVEKYLGKSFSTYSPSEYREQVVAGFIYVITINVDDEGVIEIRVYVDLQGKEHLQSAEFITTSKK